jgi:hypothetical protein
MELEITVFQAQEDRIFLTVNGLAQGLVQFPDLHTLYTFLIDCEVILGSFEEYPSTTNGIPDAILKAFRET